jgi:hypothetical protein
VAKELAAAGASAAEANGAAAVHVLVAKKKQRVAPTAVASSPTPAASATSEPLATPTEAAYLGGLLPEGCVSPSDLFSPPLVAPAGSPSSGGGAAAAPQNAAKLPHPAAVDLEAEVAATEGAERPAKKKRITPTLVQGADAL